ncbi:MAG: hypothetical protein IT223_01945, partial [Crocinitomicaceae bacterium]|nr:hypothetical protein [Crocinitomicaceae bacterium]
PTSGVRNGYTGAIFETDRGSYYSSDYLGDDTTYDLNFSGSWAIMNNYYRSFGRSVRCIKD